MIDGHCKEDDECEGYERRDEDAQTQEAENANAGEPERLRVALADGLQSRNQ